MKVMLVDDHLLFLEGLQYLLETYGVEVVGKAKDGNEALAKAQVLQPDIILMDISMPKSNGLEALERIHEKLPQIKIIMLTTSENDEDLFKAMRLGASGYLLKSTDGKKLLEYLEDAMKGEVPLSPGLATRIIGEFKRVQKQECSHKQMIEKPTLTERQLEILELIAHGATYKEVGDKLGLSERTVKYHIGKIQDMLHLENKAQVILYAAQNGLITDI